MKYDVLLADVDGTLMDFHAGEKNALTAVLKAFDLPWDDETIALYSRINAGHWKKLERGETTQARLRIDRFHDFVQALSSQADYFAMNERFAEELGQQRILISGALELCRTVSVRIPIVLVTNGISRIQRSRFDGCAFTPFLQGVVISEELGHSKPEPHMVWEGMRLAGISDPRRAVLLGDSVTADVAAARNANVDSILFTGGAAVPVGHGATYTAQTLAEAAIHILQP